MPDLPAGAAQAPLPWLSIVIPAHNEEQRLPGTLREIDRWIASAAPGPVEVIVVENASSDRTAAVVEALRADLPYLRLISATARGKGLAVRTGMLAAAGRWRFLCDADLSMPIDELSKFIALVEGGEPPAALDVLIGSREAPGAHRFGEPPLRHIMGRVYNRLVRLAIGTGIGDTQCGFKWFAAAAADDLFACSRLAGFGFDPEILYVAGKRGYRVREVPIDWHYRSDSRVRPLPDTFGMLRDLVSIRVFDWRGLYERPRRPQQIEAAHEL